MSFPRYPAYKDSGVVWLGEIPSHWDVKPMKWVIERNDGGVWGNDPTGEDDTVVLRSTEQTVDGRWQLDEPALRSLSGTEKASSLLATGDLLVTKSSGSALHIGKTTLVTPEVAALVCCYSNFMQRLRLKSGFDSRLAWYLMNNEIARTQFDLLSNSTTGLANLNGTILGELVTPIPSVDEQAAIVEFLDRETAKIDALVAEQEQLITLLKEKRQAVISHAVTKGLDPSVPMKDSGVEWLGEVPAHWHISALKHVCDVRDGTHDTPQFLTPTEDTFPFVTTKDLGSDRVSFDEAKHISREDYENFSRRSRVDPGDVLMPMIGSIGGAVLVDTDEPFAIKNIALFKRSDRFDPRWLVHFLNSDLSSVQFDLNRSGGVQGFVALGVLRDLRIPVPPKAEQIRIADNLSKVLSHINELMDLASRAIATLQERRSALVSAAVTGQIDVRGLAADKEAA